jgi:hypothetical protein
MIHVSNKHRQTFWAQIYKERQKYFSLMGIYKQSGQRKMSRLGKVSVRITDSLYLQLRNIWEIAEKRRSCFLDWRRNRKPY